MVTAEPACPTVSTGAATSTFTSAIKLLAASQCLITEDWPRDGHLKDGDWFDVIVAGGGTAGSVVANRLSENNDLNVLLIEAGGDPPQESIIPNLAASLWGDEKYDWNYKCVNDKDIGQGFESSPTVWPRGKMLGGSGGINLMIYLKGVENDYQQWYDLGNKEWHPDVVKKYYKKAENLQDPILLANSLVKDTYGTDGPISINIFNSTKRDITKKVLSAYEEIGIKNVPDLNAAGQMGSGLFTATVANGERVSGATAYLDPIRNRTNLKVIKNALVTKILIDKESKIAYGVQVERKGKKYEFYNKLDLVISTGAINTPQLLMLSGIGPKKALSSHKIDTIVNLPGVGQNLQDQTIVPIPIFANQPKEWTPLQEAADAVRYLADRSGFLGDLSPCDVSAFYSVGKNTSIPDIQNLLAIYRVNSSESFPLLKQYKPSVSKELLEKASKKALYLFQVVTLHPLSRGYITLKSADPKKPPLIYANYFKEEKDLDNVVLGLKKLSKIVKTSYFKSIKAKIARMNYKPCNSHDFESSDYWRCVALNFVTTVYHPIGTAKMGNDKDAVVDGRLRVHGVKGLRVVDGSIMPTMPSCNTNGPVFMIAERASDLIKEDFDDADYVSSIAKDKISTDD